jgi:hypothetical protein
VVAPGTVPTVVELPPIVDEPEFPLPTDVDPRALVLCASTPALEVEISVCVCTLGAAEVVSIGVESSVVEEAIACRVVEASTISVEDVSAGLEFSVVEDEAATSLDDAPGESSQLVKQLHPPSTLTLHVQPPEQYQLLSIPEQGILPEDEGQLPFGCAQAMISNIFSQQKSPLERTYSSRFTTEGRISHWAACLICGPLKYTDLAERAASTGATCFRSSTAVVNVVVAGQIARVQNFVTAVVGWARREGSSLAEGRAKFNGEKKSEDSCSGY